MTDKLMGAIGLCRKAGKLVMGSDPVAEAVRERKAALVLTASDFAPRSQRQADRVCEQYQVVLVRLPCTMDQLAALLGKTYGVLAVCDLGFARMIRGLLGENNG